LTLAPDVVIDPPLNMAFVVPVFVRYIPPPLPVVPVELDVETNVVAVIATFCPFVHKIPPFKPDEAVLTVKVVKTIV